MMRSLSLSRLGICLLALAYFSGCVISPESVKWNDKSNVLLVAQEKDAEQAKIASGRKKVIYAAFALHSDSAAFQGDVTLARDVLLSINSQIAVLLLSNQFERSDIVYPFATKENVKTVLSKVVRLADKDTVVLLLFTSHGSPNLLNIKIGDGDYSDQLAAEELRRYLEDLKPIPTIIIISACYSGSFVPSLSSEKRIIITSASKDRTSFGCSPESKATYFTQAFFQNSFDASLSLSQLFSQARSRVAEQERRQNLIASEPQMFIGDRMKKFASLPLSELLTKTERP
jgi:Peptidase C13 family